MKPPVPVVRLEPLPASSFPAWGERSRRGFVEQQVTSGTMPAPEAERYAGEQFALLLPAGLDTPGHHVWTVVHEDRPVGDLWLRLGGHGAGREAYVLDIALAPAARGRGLGRATMLAAERVAGDLGAVRVRLNVFGHNRAARGLYDSLGYQVAATSLTKRLDPAAPAPTGARPAVALRPVTGVVPATLRPGHERWAGYDGGVEVAALRLELAARSTGWHATGHDLVVGADLRRRGYGRAVVAAAERMLADRGVASAGLSVPGADTAARALFGNAGFAVGAELRVKPLPG